MNKDMHCPAFSVNTDGTYTLLEAYTAQTFVMGETASCEECSLLANGQLIINKGFVWDGPSGPAVDTANTLMPSALHDGLYRLIRLGYLLKHNRLNADKSYRDSLKTWGVSWWRRTMHFKGVDWFGWSHI